MKIKRTIIGEHHYTLERLFNGRDYSDFSVSGLLIKYELWGLTWYRIKIFKPRIHGVYDGCYSSRAKIKSVASQIKRSLKQNLYHYKYGGVESA